MNIVRRVFPKKSRGLCISAKCIILIVGILFLGSVPLAQGVQIKVKNPTNEPPFIPFTYRLSDLTVYKNEDKSVNDPSEQHVILKSNDATDDVDIAPGQEKLFDANFTPKAATYSYTLAGNERVDIVLDITIADSGTELCFFDSYDTPGADLYVAVNRRLTVPTFFTNGTTFEIIDGQSAVLGNRWYFSTTDAITIDEAGDFINGTPFTGVVEVVGQFEVTIVTADIPTLTEWSLIIFGVLLLGFITWVFLRRRKVVDARA